MKAYVLIGGRGFGNPNYFTVDGMAIGSGDEYSEDDFKALQLRAAKVGYSLQCVDVEPMKDIVGYIEASEFDLENEPWYPPCSEPYTGEM